MANHFSATPDPKKVFIIHGRSKAARVAVEHFVKSLDLLPIDFDELAANQGGAAFVGDIVRAGLNQAQGIIAIFTPDEYAALRPCYRGKSDRAEEIKRWQARPNVIFEAGMAYGMAPERTILVTLGTDVSLFSDVGGVHVVRLDNQIASRARLRNKLIGVNCAVNQRSDGWTDPTKSGDFDLSIGGVSNNCPRDPFEMLSLDEKIIMVTALEGGFHLEHEQAFLMKAGFRKRSSFPDISNIEFEIVAGYCTVLRFEGSKSYHAHDVCVFPAPSLSEGKRKNIFEREGAILFGGSIRGRHHLETTNVIHLVGTVKKVRSAIESLVAGPDELHAWVYDFSLALGWWKQDGRVHAIGVDLTSHKLIRDKLINAPIQ